MGPAPMLLGTNILIVIRAHRKVARLAGDLAGPMGGAAGTLVALLGPIVVIGSLLFAQRAVSRRDGPGARLARVGILIANSP